jgi:hypothetical protein
MHKKPPSRPNPRRIAAGRRNRLLRGPLTVEGRERLRQAALRNKPWLYSTGPRSDEGKFRSANNGRYAQKSDRSQREIQAGVADVWRMIREMAGCRRIVKSEG